MIFVTGDTHCPIDIHKLGSKSFPAKDLTRDDYVIICGDAGFVWHGRDREDAYWQKWIQQKPWTTLFVDGNHENHAKLDEMPVSRWHGGNVHFLRENVIHLMRGEVFDIDGKSFFAMGGASSHDKEYRVENISWWARELPDDSEYDNALNNLESRGMNVDFVITHCCPKFIQQEISDRYENDKLTCFFNVLSETLTFRRWFFGHYHADFNVGQLYRGVYNDIILIDPPQ